MREQSARAFTLVEIMVSISVLLCLILMVSQLVSSVTVTTTNATKLIDSDNEARLIFSKMADDFNAIFNRTDVNYYFNSQNGNDSFYFYSQAPGHVAAQDPAGTDDSTLSNASLVGYRVSDTVSGSDRIELERLGLGLHWMDVSTQTEADGNAKSVLFLPYLIKDAFSKSISNPYNNSSNPAAGAATNPSQWDVIGDQVFRMEFCFLLKDGTFSATPFLKLSGVKNNLAGSSDPGVNDDSSAGYSVGSRWYNKTSQVAYRCTNASSGAATWVSVGLQDVKAVVVTLALLDTKSRATTTTSAIVKAAAVLADFSASPLAGTWSVKASDASSMGQSSGLGLRAAQSVRIYERFFYVN